MDNESIKLMWEWYVLPAIVLTLFIGILFLASDKPEKNPYKINGVNKAEIVSRWEK